MTEVWYRFNDSWSPGSPPWLEELPVERHTSRCVVLNDYGQRRYVLKDARKRYAYPTKELALDSYIIRKKRQMQHAAASYDNAKANLTVAEQIARGEGPMPESVFCFVAPREAVA